MTGRYVPCGVSYMPACISLILDIRPPARPGVPPSWCAGGDNHANPHTRGWLMRPWPTCSSRLVVLNCSLRDLCLPGIVRPRETHLGHDSIANSWGPRSIALDCDEYSCIERPCCCCCGPTGERHTKDQKEHTGSKRSVIEGLAPDYPSRARNMSRRSRQAACRCWRFR